MNATKANNLPAAATRVISKSGMCGNVQLGGVVLCQVEDRWGTHALVLMDDGTTRKCNGLTNVGIGWYAA